MKKSNKTVITLLAVIIAGVLLSVPVSFLMDKESYASSANDKSLTASSQTAEAQDSNYMFVVLEDENVPLAAAPVSSPIHSPAVLAVAIILSVMICIAYTYWYLMTKSSIKSYSYAITNTELRRIVPKNSFIHPIDLANAEREVLFRAATK